MELRAEPAVAGLEMSEAKSGAGGTSEGDDYESLPSHASFTTHMTAGAVAGVLEHTVMYPVDSVKTRMQSLQPDPNAQYRGVYEALRRIVRTEGVLRLLRGLNITVLGAGPAHALYFACYERIKHSLSNVIQNGGNSHLANGLAGSVATVLHDAVMNPAEVVKQRLQMYRSPYRGLFDCVLTVSRTEGAAAFYRSYSTQLTMNIPFQAVHFIVYEVTQERLNPERRYWPGTHMLSGAAAGAVSAAVTTPLDVCKTLLNTQENVALSSVHVSGHLSGMANAFRAVYRLGGVPAFFRGVQARVIYQMPSTAIAWSVYEFFKYFLTQRKHHGLEGPSRAAIDRAGTT
ncbi:mitoferrin-1 [Electrophorus electricus]|uniref:Mitoferrin-1 n=1 Tax=Electrophorus electricus TaxID=8005 RepID=A0AAY5EXE1_ELEEL|nr:mitoferrin-1 [Electrophorus electricus]